MERFFENMKNKEVPDNGFSMKVMEHISNITPPSRYTYRTPTLIAALATTAAIVILTMTVGMDTMNDKYDKVKGHLSFKDHAAVVNNK